MYKDTVATYRGEWPRIRDICSLVRLVERIAKQVKGVCCQGDEQTDADHDSFQPLRNGDLFDLYRVDHLDMWEEACSDLGNTLPLSRYPAYLFEQACVATCSVKSTVRCWLKRFTAWTKKLPVLKSVTLPTSLACDGAC